jgi:hypothetical protein
MLIIDMRSELDSDGFEEIGDGCQKRRYSGPTAMEKLEMVVRNGDILGLLPWRNWRWLSETEIFWSYCHGEIGDDQQLRGVQS